MPREVVFGAEPKRIGEACAEVLAHGDLLRLLVRRDLSLVYRQTVLGIAWAVLRPLLAMAVLTLVFGRLAGLDSDGAPYLLFSYAAVVPWTYFSSAVQSSSMSLVHGAHVLTRVYFPRLLLPLTPVLAQLVDFAVALLLIGILLLFFPVNVTWQVVFLPVLVLIMMATALGLGLCLSALAIQYRDVKHLVPVLMQLLMFLAPVVWPVSMVTHSFGTPGRLLYALYPMSGVIEGFRSVLLGTVPMPWDMLAVGGGSALVLLASGAVFFLRRERTFADVA